MMAILEVSLIQSLYRRQTLSANGISLIRRWEGQGFSQLTGAELDILLKLKNKPKLNFGL